MTQRRRLPNRRPCESFGFRHGNIEYVVSLGFNPDGKLGEIFLSTTKAGTDLDAQARDSALQCSLLLQYGCPLETIFAALTRDNDGRPAGALGRAIEIAMAGEGN